MHVPSSSKLKRLKLSVIVSLGSTDRCHAQVVFPLYLLGHSGDSKIPFGLLKRPPHTKGRKRERSQVNQYYVHELKMKKRTTGSDVPLCFELYEKSYTGLEQFSIVLKLIQISFVFALFRSVIGPEKLPSLSHPLRCKTNHAFVAHVFPRFKQFFFF